MYTHLQSKSQVGIISIGAGTKTVLPCDRSLLDHENSFQVCHLINNYCGNIYFGNDMDVSLLLRREPIISCVTTKMSRY